VFPLTAVRLPRPRQAISAIVILLAAESSLPAPRLLAAVPALLSPLTSLICTVSASLLLAPLATPRLVPASLASVTSLAATSLLPALVAFPSWLSDSQVVRTASPTTLLSLLPLVLRAPVALLPPGVALPAA
jgi:hypothetical protein